MNFLSHNQTAWRRCFSPAEGNINNIIDDYVHQSNNIFIILGIQLISIYFTQNRQRHDWVASWDPRVVFIHNKYKMLWKSLHTCEQSINMLRTQTIQMCRDIS